MPAGLSSLVIQLQVFFTIGLAIAFLGDRLQRHNLIGAAVAGAGIVLLAAFKLASGMMIATMSDTPERRKIVDIVEPSYYGSGTNVLAPKSAKLTSWEGLRGKKVCLIQGSFYNKELQEKYGIEGVAFPGTAEAYAALKNGNCVGFAYDDTAIVGEMQKPDWPDYEMPLDSILFVPWGLAVNQGEKGFADFMSIE